jgi:hypothetical protein
MNMKLAIEPFRLFLLRTAIRASDAAGERHPEVTRAAI